MPPLRISLSRTPSEDGNAVVTGEESNSTSVASSRKRGPKNHSKKQPSPEESAFRDLDDSAQRVTRCVPVVLLFLVEKIFSVISFSN